ncbi:MAG: substrate-binding domain-containing protein [Sphaerochaetaceae bacterium]|nr:substrate-binding domain-containing protein [Sphaerochaetaceae bacterium]MDC7247902.1 substrate-binding domain-containing protein [Sphaerochaetaceae bacterium]
MKVRRLIAIMMICCVATLVFAQGGSESAGEDQITIGFSSKDNSDVFVKNITDAAVAKADELGVKLLMADARGDVNTQISDVENFIVQDVDVVIVIPQSVEGSAPVVSMCNDAGIPIIVCNGDIADTNYTAFVGCTDQESGEILGTWMMENVAEGSNIAIIEGPMGQSGQVGRYNGFKAVGMLDYFNVLSVQTANWKRDEAMALAEDWLTTYGDDLDAIVCENDDMGMGALSAALAAGRDDVVIGGVDAIDDAVQAVKAGTYGISVLQDAAGQGGGSIEVAVKIAKGEDFPKDTRIPFVGITAENVEAYLEGGVAAITE